MTSMAMAHLCGQIVTLHMLHISRADHPPQPAEPKCQLTMSWSMRSFDMLEYADCSFNSFYMNKVIYN